MSGGSNSPATNPSAQRGGWSASGSCTHPHSLCLGRCTAGGTTRPPRARLPTQRALELPSCPPPWSCGHARAGSRMSTPSAMLAQGPSRARPRARTHTEPRVYICSAPCAHAAVPRGHGRARAAIPKPPHPAAAMWGKGRGARPARDGAAGWMGTGVPSQPSAARSAAAAMGRRGGSLVLRRGWG